MRRYISALALGIGGVAILMSLGVWQVRRLDWKEGIIAEMNAKMQAEPVALDTIAEPDPERDVYLPVSVAGTTTGDEVRVLSGQKELGPGFEVISAFETESGRRILLDRGFVPEAAFSSPRPAVDLRVTGNLHWPDEADDFTPEPDLTVALWFARDVDSMSRYLKTDPVMVVTRTAEGDPQGIVPVPVDTSSIPNDHRDYAITWFSLAAVWAGMTVMHLWRIRRRTN